jgi:hypothetical protein
LNSAIGPHRRLAFNVVSQIGRRRYTVLAHDRGRYTLAMHGTGLMAQRSPTGGRNVQVTKHFIN